MAFAFVDVAANGNSNVAGSSYTHTVQSNWAVDDFIVVAIALDNLGTSDAETSQVTGVTVGTNTFTKAVEYTNGSLGANAGATVSIWYCVATQAATGGSSTFSVSLSGSTTNKGITGSIFSRDTSKTVQVVSGSKATGEAKSITSGTIPNGTAVLLFRGLAIEDNENAIDTATASWTASVDSSAFTTGGGAASNMACGSEHRIMTGTGAGVTSNPGGTSSGDMASAIIAFEEVTAGTNLTPSLFTNSQTFYQPTVTPGAVTLTPSLFTNTNTFYSPTVGIQQFLTPDLFTNTNSFNTHTATSVYALTPSLFTNSQSFFSPTVTPGAVTLTPSLFTNSQTFFSPTVAQGTQNLAPDLFTNTNSFFSPTATSVYGLTPGLFTNSQSFFSPTASATYGLTPSLFTNSQSFFSPTVTNVNTLAPSLFTNSQTFFSPTVTNIQTLTPSLFTNTTTFYSPTIVIPQAVQPALFVNDNLFFVPTVYDPFRDRVGRALTQPLLPKGHRFRARFGRR